MIINTDKLLLRLSDLKMNSKNNIIMDRLREVEVSIIETVRHLRQCEKAIGAIEELNKGTIAFEVKKYKGR